MNILVLSLNLLRRDWRAGEWRILLLALLLAVASIATVELFADRVRLALQQQATSLIGADLRISSTRALPQSYRDEAMRRGLLVAESWDFPSMASAHGHSVLGRIQAVGEGYPLRGKVLIRDQREHAAQIIPASGTLWADARLIQRLDLQPGDEVSVGALHLRLAAEIVRDVDQSVGFASFAPSLMINAADLPASGLVQEGSRITQRLLVAGQAKQVAGLRNWLQGRLGIGERMEDVRDARPEIRTALERAEHFLGLAALTAVVLAGVALALAARHFLARHLDACAMMRCLGAGQSQVLRIFLFQFLLVGVAAALLGDLFGYVSQSLLVESIPEMREAQLPAPGGLPLLQAGASGIVLLLGFAFLPLRQLKRVSPLRVIRRELGAPEATAWALYAGGGAVLCALFLWQAGSVKLGLTVLGGLVAGMLMFGMLALGLLRMLARLRFQAFSNLARHGRSNAIQIVALSLGSMALLLLTFVRADLMKSWQSRLPPDAPNHFIVNIQPDQRAAIREFFGNQQLPTPELYPMVRGRLVAINQRPVSSRDYEDQRARGLVEREFNLSWSATPPPENPLLQGKWWSDDQTGELSVEEGIAKTLGIHMGDTLTYDVAGSQFSARVSNLRKVQWDSMRVNFFVITTPDLLKDFPASYITSFYLPEDRLKAADTLARKFPNLLLIDTGQMIEQVRNIMDQIARTMSAVFLFTLLSGLVVLYAALLATQDERIHQGAILRTLGADSGYLRRLHLTEFAMLGALSGLFAAGGAEMLGWVLARQVLDIPYHPGAMIWLAGVGGGIVIVALAGWLATGKVIRSSPLRVLQSI